MVDQPIVMLPSGEMMFDRETGFLKVRGPTEGGGSVEIHWPVETPRHFLLKLGTLFQDPTIEHSIADVIPATEIVFDVAQDEKTGEPAAMVLHILVGATRMTFLLPLDHLNAGKRHGAAKHAGELRRLLAPPATTPANSN